MLTCSQLAIKLSSIKEEEPAVMGETSIAGTTPKILNSGRLLGGGRKKIIESEWNPSISLNLPWHIKPQFLRVLLLLMVIFMSLRFCFAQHGYYVIENMARPSLTKVYIAFRHGSRSPVFSYNGDAYSANDTTYWPEGPGMLTKAGKNEAYTLGKNLRTRYREFLGDYYTHNIFKMYSTLLERTMMSAQLVAAGLFPPVGHQEWNSDINWQPIPVFPDLTMNGTNSMSCPQFKIESNRILSSLRPEYIGLSEEDIELIRRNVHEPDIELCGLAAKLWDSTYFQERAGYPLPDWIKPIYPKKLCVSALRFLKFWLAGSPIQRTLIQDPIANSIGEFFNKTGGKMELHSLHDVNLLSILYLLQINPNVYPEPASAIAIELHANEDGEDYFETYYYRNSNNLDPIQVVTPFGSQVARDDMMHMLKRNFAVDYELLCNSHVTTKSRRLGN